MSYTIVRPGGMERPKDDYKETHNLVLKPRDTIFGGQVRFCAAGGGGGGVLPAGWGGVPRQKSGKTRGGSS